LNIIASYNNNDRTFAINTSTIEYERLANSKEWSGWEDFDSKEMISYRK